MSSMSPPRPLAYDPNFDPKHVRYVDEQPSIRWWVPPLVMIAFVGLIIFGVHLLIEEAQPVYTAPPIAKGSIVSMKLDGRKGMVLWGRCVNGSSCYYSVRFSAPSLETDTHLLGPDGPVTSGAYSDVYVQEFEIAG